MKRSFVSRVTIQMLKFHGCLMKSRLFLLLVGAAISQGAFGQDPFGENIRKTEALTPEQEQKVLHVPAGFEVQLVASEPDDREADEYGVRYARAAVDDAIAGISVCGAIG